MGDAFTTIMAMTPFGNAVSNSANNKANWNLTTSVQKQQKVKQKKDQPCQKAEKEH